METQMTPNSQSNLEKQKKLEVSGFLTSDYTAAAAAKSLQLCLTLCDPMDCSLPGSSVNEIFQARVLEWVAIAFSYYKAVVIKMVW